MNFPWFIIPGERYLTVKLEGEVGKDSLPSFEEEILPEASGANPPFVIIDCLEATAISRDWMQGLGTLHNLLIKKNKGLRIIQANEAVVSSIKHEGFDTTLLTCSLREAMVAFGILKKLKLDASFLRPFLEATVKVLQVLTETKCMPGVPVSKKSNDGRFAADVSGVMGIVSEVFNGSVIISFPEATFLKLMSRMMDEEIVVMTKSIQDGAGELANMIFGQAKIALNQKGFGIKTAIPVIIKGTESFGPIDVTTKSSVVVPFETDIGPFFIEIRLSV